MTFLELAGPWRSEKAHFAIATLTSIFADGATPYLLPLDEIGLLLGTTFGGIWALMIFSRDGHRLLAGGLVFSFSIWFAVQDVAAQGATQVLTPFGYRDSTKVHRVPEGYELIRMPDTHIRMQNPKTGDYTDFPKPIVANQQKAPLPDNGWVTFASWYNPYSKPISYFVTDWNVPPNPKTNDGQTLFIFNSIEPASGDAILQPVLQFGPSAAGGGGYWAITSWYVVGDTAYIAPGLYYVTPGTFLGGQIRLTGSKAKRGEFSYSCDFYGYSGTTLQVSNIPKLVWATETLEVYRVDQCTDFPNTVYSLMSSIGIQLKGGITPSVGWSINDVATDCGVQTTIVTNGASNGAVAIFY